MPLSKRSVNLCSIKYIVILEFFFVVQYNLYPRAANIVTHTNDLSAHFYLLSVEVLEMFPKELYTL